MKTKFLLIILVILALSAGTLVMLKSADVATEVAHEGEPAASVQATAPPAAKKANPRIPAYQLAAEVGNLPPTLASSEFFGKAREAYDVAKKIPETLAQLPCYCECDKAFGHKSLHTCFVDDHASHCAVCVDEALLAYQLQKVEKLTPEQVREKIVEKYSVDQHQHQH